MGRVGSPAAPIIFIIIIIIIIKCITTYLGFDCEIIFKNKSADQH